MVPNELGPAEWKRRLAHVALLQLPAMHPGERTRTQSGVDRQLPASCPGRREKAGLQ